MGKGKVKCLPKGTTGHSWFFEQNVYFPESVIRALKSTEGSGNIPKVILVDYEKREEDKDKAHQ